MNKLMINLIFLLIIGSIIGAGGQIFLKNGVNELGKIDIKFKSLIVTVFKVLTNKYIFLGLCMSAASAFLWIIVISGNKLSFAYPLGTSVFCIMVLIFSKVFLKETISLGGWAGVFFILTGIITVFYSK